MIASGSDYSIRHGRRTFGTGYSKFVRQREKAVVQLLGWGVDNRYFDRVMFRRRRARVGRFPPSEALL